MNNLLNRQRFAVPPRRARGCCSSARRPLPRASCPPCGLGDLGHRCPELLAVLGCQRRQEMAEFCGHLGVERGRRQWFRYTIDAVLADGAHRTAVVEGRDTYGTTAVVAVESARASRRYGAGRRPRSGRGLRRRRFAGLPRRARRHLADRTGRSLSAGRPLRCASQQDHMHAHRHERPFGASACERRAGSCRDRWRSTNVIPTRVADAHGRL